MFHSCISYLIYSLTGCLQRSFLRFGLFQFFVFTKHLNPFSLITKTDDMFYRSSNKENSVRGIARVSEQGVVSEFLHDYTKKWVTCQYCGRTLQYCQLITHFRKFHDYDNNLILDFNQAEISHNGEYVQSPGVYPGFFLSWFQVSQQVNLSRVFILGSQSLTR